MAASSTHRYPATRAWEVSASIDCAREMRGTSSSANDVTPASAQRAHGGQFGRRRREADGHRPAAEPCRRLGGERTNVQQHVEVAEPQRVDDGGAGLLVRGIRVTGCLARAVLDEHLQPQAHQLAHGLGGGGHSPLAYSSLSRDADPHGSSSHTECSEAGSVGESPYGGTAARVASVPVGAASARRFA